MPLGEIVQVGRKLNAHTSGFCARRPHGHGAEDRPIHRRQVHPDAMPALLKQSPHISAHPRTRRPHLHRLRTRPRMPRVAACHPRPMDCTSTANSGRQTPLKASELQLRMSARLHVNRIPTAIGSLGSVFQVCDPERLHLSELLQPRGEIKGIVGDVLEDVETASKDDPPAIVGRD